MRSKKLLLGGLLLLGIGFATVSTTLYLTGNVNIATNDKDFDVIFTKAISETGATATISPDGKTITFGTKDLVTVGDKSVLDFEVTNNSTMYDAEVSINCTAGSGENKYYSITKEVETPIDAKTTETGKVEVELLKASAEDIHEEFTCTLTATAKERTTIAEEPKVKYTPKYFAIGAGYDIPTTASTQDYRTLGKNVFVGLDADGVQKSICIIRNGSLECFKDGEANVTEEQAHLQEVFSDISCSSDDGSFFRCNASDFYCSVHSSGAVSCNNYVARFSCGINSEGHVYCG